MGKIDESYNLQSPLQLKIEWGRINNTPPLALSISALLLNAYSGVVDKFEDFVFYGSNSTDGKKITSPDGGIMCDTLLRKGFGTSGEYCMIIDLAKINSDVSKIRVIASIDAKGKDDLDKLESEIHKTGMFTMQNSKAESCIIVHVPVNTSFDWTLLTYIPMTDINKNNIDWPLVIVVSFCLLILLVFDILVFMRFNRKLAAAAQEADSANKAKTDFLSTMSHDIRTPMQS